MLIYRTGAGRRSSVYKTEYAGQACHTIAQFHVDDVTAEARALQEKGVALETYDMPGVSRHRIRLTTSMSRSVR